MGFFDFLDPNKESREFLERVSRQLQEAELEHAMVEQGWRVWPANATEEEQRVALEAYLLGEKPTWYPLGYREELVITEGKLQVEPEEEEKKRWWLW